jgi:predicted O-linked N-acetylglucosamine transferase (SPINDLY family)
LKPDSPAYHSNLGNALKDLGQLDQAVAAYRTSIQLNSGYTGVHYNLGIALRGQGQIDQAVAAYRTAIQLEPRFAAAQNNLGTALKDLGQLDEAIAAYRTAIQIHPQFAEAHNNLGTALKDFGQLDEAIVSYRTAIKLNPRLAAAHNNLGTALKYVGELEQAVAAFRKAIKLNPHFAEAHSNLIFCLHHHPGYDASAIAEEAGRWNQRHAEPLKHLIQPHGNDRSPDRRLRVGYLSADFRKHPVGRFLLPVLEHHDHAAFGIFCYADVRHGDDMTEQLRRHADQWRTIVGLGDQQVAQTVREDRIDILVDLAGHTAGNRLLVFARKPAPVQVTWLGFPDTTGLTTVDYRITDIHADPPEVGDALYSEQLIRLPRTNWVYRPPENCPAPSERPENDSITFGCFNNLNKVTKPMLELWGTILASVPSSSLLLKARAFASPEVQQRVRRIFQDQGIALERVELAGWEGSTADHLARYHQIAIGLDSFPYHGTTTTCEALWMGVPVITLAGQTHVSRVGVSLLTNVGLGELIADSPADYVRIAVQLANDFPRLRSLHATLRQRMERSPLMDPPLFAQNIEAAYRDMWRRWCAKQAI